MEDKTFQLLEKMYGELIEFKKETNDRFDKIENEASETNSRLDRIENGANETNSRFDTMNERFNRIENEVKKTNFTIEHDIIPKINVLFDGYKQNTDQLERIEKAVSKHEDIIIRKIK